MKRTAAAALALSMAVSTAAVPASAGYTIDMSDAKITGDVEIKQEADGSGTKITISVDGHDKTTDFSDGKEDDKITITGDNTKSAATTTAAADAAKDDTKAPETTVTENKDGTVISYTGKLDAQPDQEVSRPDSQNDPEADQKNQGDQADQNDPEADQKNQGDQGDQSDPEADQKNQNDQKNQSDPEADQKNQNDQNKDSEDADAGIMTYEAPAPTTLTSAVATAVRNVIKIINKVAGAENALNITLDNAKIESDSDAAMKISGEGDVNIELNRSNVLTSGGAHAGLEKNDEDSKGRLTIRDDLRNDGKEKTGEEKKAEEDAVAAGESGDAVEDVGSLTATGGSDGGAGIGGGDESYFEGSKSTSSIVINGGKIKATGGKEAVGIGGGCGGKGGRVNRKDPDDRSQTITINGGNIDAAGIGGGAFYPNNGGDGAVTINGGHIKSEGKYGAGIGGGWGHVCGGDGDVLITGGVIEAEGLGGAGIGGGGSDTNSDYDLNAGCSGGDAKVKIRGKNTIITKAEGKLGAGIGGGSAFNLVHPYFYEGGSAEIEITDGATVEEAVGGEGGAGIGSGAGDGYRSYKPTYAHVTIKNATVESAKSKSPSKGNTYGAGIGGGGTKGEYWNGENVIRIINSVIGRFQLDANGNRQKDENGNYLLEDGTGALGNNGSEGIGRGANERKELSEILNGKNDVIIDNSWVPDGDKMKQEFNHDWHDTETLPTCTEDGEKGKVCSRCGMKETEKIPALGHDWGAWTVTTPATCTKEGVETRICNRDSSHVETRTIPATGHNWVDNGNGTHTCTNCGATEAFGALELRVVDAEGMNKPFTVSQNGTLRTYTGAYDTATLTGDLNTLRYLQDHGAQTIQFVTNGQTSSFDINDLLAQGSGSEVFYLTHRGTEEPTLLLVEADHSELVKD